MSVWIILAEIFNIKDLKTGKHVVYKQLFMAFYTPLCNYAFSILKDDEEAEDIVQKTFCMLWDKREIIEIKTSVKSYLYRIIHNECLNKIRQNKIRAEHNQIYVSEKDTSTNDVEGAFIGNELKQRISVAIDKLPPRCREVFVKSRMEQLMYSEIAAEMNISVNTVENQMAKALRILRENLKDYVPLLLLLILKMK